MKSTHLATYAVLLALAATVSFSIGKRSAPPAAAPAISALQAVRPTPDPVIRYPHLQAAASPQLQSRRPSGQLSDDIATAAANYGFVGDRPAPAFLDQLSIEEIPDAISSIEALDEPARTTFLIAVISRSANFDPDSSAAYALKMLHSSELQKGLNSIASAWGSNDPEAAIAWHAELLDDTEHITHPTQITGILRQVFYQWAKRDLPAAIARAAELSGDDLFGSFTGIGDLAKLEEFRQPILDSVVELESEVAQRQALLPAIKAWAKQDISAAATWLDENRITDQYIVKAVATHYTETDPLASAQWQVQRAQTPEEREAAIKNLSKGKYGRPKPLAPEIAQWLESLAEVSEE